MEKYLSAIQQANPDYLWRNQFGAPFGDWLTPTVTTPEDLIATAYWAYDVSLMRDMAAASGRTADVRKYRDLFNNIKAAFIKAYVRPDGFVRAANLYPSIPPPTVNPARQAAETTTAPVETQTGYVLALHMNLLPEELRAASANRGYLIEHGATTTWERWNGGQMLNDPAMNSYNHYAYGTVGEWIYRYAAGVDAAASDPGFHTIYLHPNFDSPLGSLDFSYESSYGSSQRLRSTGGYVCV